MVGYMVDPGGKGGGRSKQSWSSGEREGKSRKVRNGRRVEIQTANQQKSIPGREERPVQRGLEVKKRNKKEEG